MEILAAWLEGGTDRSVLFYVDGGQFHILMRETRNGNPYDLTRCISPAQLAVANFDFIAHQIAEMIETLAAE